MLYYQELWEKNYSDVSKEKRAFRNPQWFLERTKDLSQKEQYSELVYLMAILTEKLNQEKQDVAVTTDS